MGTGCTLRKSPCIQTLSGIERGGDLEVEHATGCRNWLKDCKGCKTTMLVEMQYEFKLALGDLRLEKRHTLIYDTRVAAQRACLKHGRECKAIKCEKKFRGFYKPNEKYQCLFMGKCADTDRTCADTKANRENVNCKIEQKGTINGSARTTKIQSIAQI